MSNWPQRALHFGAQSSPPIAGQEGSCGPHCENVPEAVHGNLPKPRSEAAGVTVGFTGRVARIANVHQKGLRNRPALGAPAVRYERRQLPGFTETALETIRNILASHLSL
ncbi:phage virion morphogenesis protein [Pseudomonas sp. MWU13-3659]|uniref:phage virion morphogenesis protein n=1 Tax=Pseudomonas TaxID=286 RepID=UPI00336AEC1F